jgi:hypothetical protein
MAAADRCPRVILMAMTMTATMMRMMSASHLRVRAVMDSAKLGTTTCNKMTFDKASPECSAHHRGCFLGTLRPLSNKALSHG